MEKADGKKAKVAIITRTKDRPLLLERAIQSVESQTYSDYVHVILNDGGDKNNLDKLLKKHKSDRRVIVHNKKTEGFTKALNQAIRAVDSKYITILDDDDSWPPERLKKTISYLEKTGEKAVVVKMDVVIEEIKDDKIHFISQHLHPESGEGEISLFKQCYKNYVSNGIVTYQRGIYEEIGGYDESLEVGEDWDFGIKLMLRYDVAFLRNEKPLFFYHQRPSQKGSQGNSVHAGVDIQEKTINIIRNRYLRQDLQNGYLGVGYIMNSIPQEESSVIRLERHVNHSVEQIRNRFKDAQKAKEDEVVLRWASNHPWRFALGRFYHYHVKRDQKRSDSSDKDSAH